MKKKTVFILLIIVIILILAYVVKEKRGMEAKFTPFDTIKREELSNIGVEVPPEINEKLAFEIGSAILESNLEYVKKDRLAEKYEMGYYVKDWENKNMYIILWGPKNSKVLGGEHGVAIDKTNGKILNTWIGE